jgi:glycosyltransferase involved in cell wall biosynthesis
MPLVSIIIPCYNEQNTIGLLLAAIYQQSFDRSKIEVIIADGMSEDRTREKIIEFQQAHPDLLIKVVDNQRRTIPSGLNEAIRNSRGKYIVRLDAHCQPYPDYVALCIETLSSGEWANVGGVWEIQAGNAGWAARSIAAASAHPLGAGDAWYRLGGKARVVDTVPFGSFRRDLFDRVGLYNEDLLTNEDYELNIRIRQSGGRLWLDPRIRSRYFARPDFRQLACQYWRYGYWKGRMLRNNPGTTRWRQLMPPLFVASLLVSGLFAIWFELARWMLFALIGIYLVILLIAGLNLALRKRDATMLVGLPLAIGVMHLAWGSGFLGNFVIKSESK